jgi:hypothetical protein
MICDSDPKMQHDYIGTAKDPNVRSAQSEIGDYLDQQIETVSV